MNLKPAIDKWNKTLFLADKKSDDGLECFLERIDRAEEMIMELVQQLESYGLVCDYFGQVRANACYSSYK